MYGSVRIFRVKPGTGDEALAETWRACKLVLGASSGFIDMLTIRSGPDEFLTVGLYESREAAERGFASANPVFWEAVSPFFAADPERYHGDLRTWTQMGGPKR